MDGEEEEEAGTSNNLAREEGHSVSLHDEVSPAVRQEEDNEIRQSIDVNADRVVSLENDHVEGEEDVKKGGVDFAPLVLTGDEHQPVEPLKESDEGVPLVENRNDEINVKPSIEIAEQARGEAGEVAADTGTSSDVNVGEMKGEMKEDDDAEETKLESESTGVLLEEEISTPPREPIEAADIEAYHTALETAIPAHDSASQFEGDQAEAEPSISQTIIDTPALDLPPAANIDGVPAETANLAEAVSAVSADEAALALQQGLAEGTTSDALQETAEAMALPEQGTTNSEMTSLFGEDTGDIEFMLGMNEIEDLKAIEEEGRTAGETSEAPAPVSTKDSVEESVEEKVDVTSPMERKEEESTGPTRTDGQSDPKGESHSAASIADFSNSASMKAVSEPSNGILAVVAAGAPAPEGDTAATGITATDIQKDAAATTPTKEQATSSDETKEQDSKPKSAITDAEKAASDATSAPTDDKTSNDSALASPTKVTNAPPVDEQVLRQIALVLKINKELIRLCVDLQAKELSTDVLYKDAALRLQCNLAFLASIADKSVKGSSGLKVAPVTALHDEPFPPTLHSPHSQLPKLYQLLRSLGMSGKTEQITPIVASTESPLPTTKRERNQSQEGKRKKQKDNIDVHATPSPITASMMPPQQQKMQSPKHISKSASNAAIASNIMSTPPPQLTPPRTPLDGQSAAQPIAAAAGGIMNGMAGSALQSQNLTQAFGPNAVNNLQALQTHYRGQPQAIVSYMEANIAGFRTLPIQMQLQHMTNIQNAAMQRQRQQSQGATPQQQQIPQQQTPFQIQQAHLRRTSAAQSPVADSPGGFMAARRTQSPMPINAGSPGSSSVQQQQPGGRPITPSSSQSTMYGQMASPALSQAIPANPLTNASLPSPQQSVAAASYALPSAAQSMMANMPAHLQQQFLQQLQHQQQQQQYYQQQQAQSNQQTPIQPQMGYNPSAMFSTPPMQSNGTMWTNPQQHQSPTG